jgi:hypothetical protein
MLKKALFVLLIAVALLAFAGSGVPTASADCSAATNCNPMFGPNFLTTQTVGASTNPTVVFNPLVKSVLGVFDIEINLDVEPLPLLPVPDCFASQLGHAGCR